MARPNFRFPVIDLFAFLGILLGGWLIQQTFQPASDLPNRALLIIAGLDLLLCFSVLGYRLRRRLHAREGLPRYWIVTGSVGLACFLGWIAALLIDADRVAHAQKHHRECDQQVGQLVENLRHFSDVLPAQQASADHGAWQVNHDRYVRLHDQMRATLRAHAAWEKHLTRVQEQVDVMHKKFVLFFAESNFDQRTKWRSDYQNARASAMQSAESLRGEIAQSERDLANTHRVRWQSIGSAALTGVVLILGALMMWIVFDRELRRIWRRHAREKAETVPTPEFDPHPQQPIEHQREIARLRDRDAAVQRELQEQRWLLDSHQQANTEGVLILSAEGAMLSWNPAFVRLWKLSNETMSAHSWQTIAAHMESLVETGWDDFRRSAISRDASQCDTCWEMTLEGGRTVEVYAQTLRDHPARRGAMQLHFRDVTTHKQLEAKLREALDPPHALRVSA